MIKIYRYQEIDKDEKNKLSLKTRKSCYQYKIKEFQIKYNFYIYYFIRFKIMIKMNIKNIF